ncbi:chaperone NapD [Yersinia mollaretii]|uniref:Chaperone NapD n=2 Tax=Yersinia TaxID=629 RepID=A0A0U1I9D9_YERMO|nr:MULTISPECIES: chaperone NapD [Yersinia]CNK24996.1 assembly protein for periplasmic nitrate reductase [Yersinia enterocolitica]AKP32648.1 nitrate reductase [Yersinia aleksiciae]MDA5499426.1 chaperone NapD [Yersinia aleksiciae]MDA5527165.1 chaperone NapD [Yersinia mollaretii]MDA5533501.1 chaperone NapD [Yersinia mollaretii]
MDDKEWHVCGLVLQAKPARFAQLTDSLLAIPGTEIPTSDAAQGKLVVVMQAARSDVLLNYIESARNLDGVLAVSLVYHQQDQQGEEMP